MTAVRTDIPNEDALRALVDRHGPALLRRCKLLAGDADRANDLAQETWCRFLRVRRTLQPDGNFPGYLAAVAINLWRDGRRTERRAGCLSDGRLLSLDASVPGDDGDMVTTADSIPHRPRDSKEEAIALDIDLAAALDRLSPALRDVVVARYLHGESSAEIGRRFGRTQQTITSWLRQAMAELEQYLGDWRSAA